MVLDLVKEQEATLTRPARKYGILAKMFFWGMDTFYGRKLSWGKVRLLEILARIPYQAWEIRQYHKLNHWFSDNVSIEEAEGIIRWGREAQDNEFWHLQMANEKIRQDNIKLNWFKDIFASYIAAFQYSVFSRILAYVNIEAAFKLNADFEDHAEHEYMKFAKEHPELDNQPVDASLVSNYGDLKTWGDVVRRMGLDERKHMNESLIRCGLKSEVVS